MKILYIAELPPEDKMGGAVAEKRNFSALESICEVERTDVFSRGRSLRKKLIDVVFSPVPTLYSRKDSAKIAEAIKNSSAEVVFIETTKMGYFAKIAKKYNKQVVIFAHNCEKMLFKDSRGAIFVPFIKKQEKLSVKYADVMLYLNERDRDCFNKHYPLSVKKTYFISPITFCDRVSEENIEFMRGKKKSGRGIFLGSDFPPNYKGVKWFIENVADKISVSIDIVGKGFEKRTELARPNVDLIGTVDDVSPYLINADFVISPIFEGSGMKVKTCEALMYGKYIFATDEALTGYKSSETAYFRCNTAEEFISALNDFTEKDCGIFNADARGLYLENYSDNVFVDIMRSVIERLGF